MDLHFRVEASSRWSAGSTFDVEVGSDVEVLLHGDHLWLGIDLLPRNHQEMIFYHLLLKLSFKRIIDPGFFTPARFSL